MSNDLLKAARPIQLPPAQKAVLIAMCDITRDRDRGECWPSIATLALYTCYGRTATIAAIKGLEAAGIITADRSNGRHTRYKINLVEDLFEPPKVVRLSDRSGKRTGSRSGRDPSATRTGPVRQADTNPEAHIPKDHFVRGARIPKNWVPDKETAEALQRDYPRVNQAKHLQDFRDYFGSMTGPLSLATDWNKRWAIRVRQLAEKIGAARPERPAAAIFTARRRDNQERIPTAGETAMVEALKKKLLHEGE